ncbi:hypothetical protein Cfor_02797 [Coptotermes formosanus]|uniref:Uncharacterized protein n=1 Tax=Coptotermes formosanus TaxID=36987 RepID=A0A6L2PBH7_COPFO|nr:hypothetical protein Cfor_02797 [Coptotermes formosanus]
MQLHTLHYSWDCSALYVYHPVSNGYILIQCLPEKENARQNTRGSIVCQEVVPLQPPSGFSDGQELSEAECDREAVSGRENMAALPLFRHEELEQELSTLVKRFVTV